jgi:dihydroorotase
MGRDFDVVFIGRFFLPTGPENCCVAVEDGRIVKIAKQLSAGYTLDFGHYLVLPGAVDTHVHFRDPGLTHKEDIKSGSTAAVFGGVTSALDMPNTDPPARTYNGLKAKWEGLRDRSLVDLGLFCEASPTTDFERARLLAIGFKAFLAPTTGGLGFKSLDSAKPVMEAALATGRPVSVHAEDPALFGRGERDETLAAHALARPPSAEANAITWLATQFDTTAVNIAHLSSAEGLKAAETSGFKGTLEASPHHALLDTDLTGLAAPAFAKTNPPVRSKADRTAIMAGLRGGRISILASDHAPHTAEEKTAPFAKAPSGVPGVETLLPLMMALAFNRQIDMQRVVDSCCRLPAERYGLMKGKIAEGYDADFAVFDPRDIKRIRPEALHSKCGWTPFGGMFAVFPVAVFLRGDEIMGEGQIRPARPPGQLLKPPGARREREEELEGPAPPPEDLGPDVGGEDE